MTRSYLSRAALQHLEQSLSEREGVILADLDRCRILSGAQIQRLRFAPESIRTRRRTLQGLTTKRLICRVDGGTVSRRGGGSASYLFALDVAGQRLLGLKEGGKARRPAVPGVPFRSHALAVSELFVRLVEAERRGQTELLDFQAEPDCWRRFPAPVGGTVTIKPDAYVRLGAGNYEDSFFLEVDQNSEGAGALRRQLDRYRAYWSSGTEQHARAVFPQIVWTAPDRKRHQQLTEACGAQPAESWRLFRVALFEEVVDLMTGVAA